MGVPSFYRWLVHKYPKIVTDAIEEEGRERDYTLPNPNGLEFDNFYLDMNGIIHPCFHPDDDVSSPTTFDDVFGRIYGYIDGLFNIVRPRKLLYMAIDGVAPRAKMNQQRARRFRTAKDTQMAEEKEEKLRKEFEIQGKAVLPEQESHVSDSNVITPGTEFMHMLSQNLQCYITRKMKENPAWTKLKVILSDDNVPGEGEHKIISFIRAQRSLPGYDPNTRHCLYGLDADLIMLALATHEVHFSILREEVLSLKTKLIETSLRYGTHKTEGDKSCLPANKSQAYQFLNVWILREYLAVDLKITSPPEKFEYDLERVIDDFIFICFFAGNDFLPHMPSLEIHEGCIDLLMHVYKKEFRNLGGYLVDMQKAEDKKGGYIKLKRVEKFILAVGTYEEKIFSKRSQIREKKMKRILAEYRDAKNDEQDGVEDGRVSDIVCSYAVAADVSKNFARQDLKISASPRDSDTVENNTKELKQKLKDYIRGQSDLFKDGDLGTNKVKYGTPGWRERYYAEKFSAQSTDEREETRKKVVAKYGEGLCWVLLYYFSGVPSWTWFYPFHYGPFASDLKGLAQTNVKFQKGLPFKPFDQLMGVLPPRSAHALPTAYKGLMTDDNSNIIDFYPIEFQTDVDGKRFMWQGICKLPFIEEGRLLKETRKLENELEDHEKLRNLQSLDRLFASCSMHEGRLVGASKKIKDAIMLDSNFDEVKGTIHVMPEDLVEAVDDNKCDCPVNVSCVFFETHQDFLNVPRLVTGVTIPDKMVEEEDIMETVLWHECYGRSNTSDGNRLPQNRGAMIKPDGKWDYTQNSAPAFIHKGSGHVFHNIGRGKDSAVSKPAVELKPAREIYDGIGGLRISNTGARTSFDKPARADSEVGWTENFVETSSQMHCPDKPFLADRGCSKERGWFQDRGVMIHDTKHNSSPRDATESVTKGCSRGLHSGGGRPSLVSKPVHEHSRGSFCGERVTRDEHPSIAKTEYDGRVTEGSLRRDVHRAPHPVLNYKHTLVTGNGGTPDTNGDWRLHRASAPDTEGVCKKNFVGGSSQIGSPNRQFSTHRGRGRGRGW